MKWLTLRQVSDLISETPHTLAQRCAAGQIPATKLGKEWRIREDDLIAWMAPTNAKPAARVRTTSTRRRSA